MCHGFTGDQSQCGIWPRLAQALAAAGYVALRFNFRFGSAREYAQTTYLSQVDDAHVAFEYLLSRKDLIRSDGAGSPVGVIGMSQGGLVSSMLAAREPRIHVRH